MTKNITVCDECGAEITNGKPFKVGALIDGVNNVYCVSPVTVKWAFDERYKISDLCSEGCLIKFEAKLRTEMYPPNIEK